MNKLLIIFLLIISSNLFAQNRLEIIKIGNPTLRMIAEEIDHKRIESSEFQAFIDDMVFTMKKAGGVGLAAPQVDRSLRMFVMSSSFPKVPLKIVINPKIEYLENSGKKSSTEGCLSIPGKSLTVKRYKKIHLSYYNRKGEFISEELDGFGAIIAQHEYDHLNGVLIVDLVEQMQAIINGAGFTDAPLM